MSLRYIKISVVGIFCLTIWSNAKAQDEEKGVIIDKIVAKVDDFIVLKSELERAYLDFLSRGEIAQGNPKCQILENLVINKLMVAKAEIDSVIVADVEVEINLDRRISYFIQQLGGEDRVEEYYGKTMEQFREELFDQIKEQMIVQKMQGEISAGISVTPAEVKRFFKLIPGDSLPYFSTEVTLGQIVKIPDISKDKKAEVRAQLLGFRERIKGGEDFGGLARKYSMDPGSAVSGGDLGFYKRGELAPEFEAAAMSMKPGEISMPIESQFGFHLIQLIERRGNSYNSRHILIIPSSSADDIRQAMEFLDSLRTLVVDEMATFELLAKEHSDDQGTNGNGGFFTDASGAMKISVEDIDPTLFFTIDTMQVESITLPMEYRMEDGTDAVRIIYYKDKISPHQANLLQDYQKIRSATLANKRNKLMSDWFRDAKEEVYINIDPEYSDCDILKN